MSQAQKRITKELKELNENPPDDFEAGPEDDSDLFKWFCTIQGPEETPYEGGKFNLKMEFPKDYPFKPPKVEFITKVFHPNVKQETGYICLGILKDDWKPDITVPGIVFAIKDLLSNPNKDHPVEVDVCKLFVEDKKKFDEVAKQWTEKYAKNNE